jgi:hypothetical protein
MNPGTDWMDQARRLLDVLRSGAGETAAAQAADGHGADCRWCPICQAAAVLRGERPEVTAALADVLTATATALRAFAGGPEGAGTPSGTDAEADEPGEEPPPAVQRIEIA